jgi:hypothetical protein
MRICIFLFFLIAAVTAATAEDLQKIYVGKNTCGPELHKTRGYGMRLDKSQNAYLSARIIDGENALMIIQYTKDGDSCGVVRDAIVSRDAKVSFEFLCVECSDPSAIVIGTWPDENNSPSSKAIEAWRINLKELIFSPISKQVTCFRETYHEYDDGEDIVHWARKGIGKKCSGK